jgi:mycofactocin system glycosyltransferase
MDGELQVVRNFPLKTIILNRAWREIFDLFTHGDFVPLDEIVSLINPQSAERVERFLDGLVRKGFLERDGLSTLSKYPFISIVIPVRNRPEDIRSCLQSLEKLDYPKERMETIVVDDASNDHTADIATRFGIRVIKLKDHKQASYCRNLGAEKANGDILAFIDSDCVADPLWLRELAPAFNDRTVGAVGGMVDAYFESKGLDRYEKVKSALNVCNHFKRSGITDRFFYVPSCNLLSRRDLFLMLGGFREDLHVGEDVDFCWNVQDSGHYVEYRPNGRVYHKHRNSVASFCSRRFDYGTSEPILQQLHPDRSKQMVFPPGAFLFWIIAAFAIILKFPLLLSLCAFVLFVDAYDKSLKVRRKGISINFPLLFMAVLRSYFALLYHCCAFISRYYLICVAFFVPLFPWGSTIILLSHLLTGLVEYFVKKPALNLFSFIYYFSLEQLSYQLGVWWGCLKGVSFRVLNPRVTWSLSTERRQRCLSKS